MSKINVLSSNIYNRIAAGEVVERPFSVVKELVENSIDAGAKSIIIEIADGGTSLIKITDDGTGIEQKELKKALLPHATSKISKISDLDSIISLGFRGEALASIASVSKICIVSKPREQEIGASIYAEGGQIGEVTECGAAAGTEITVRNLFYNTPAREKFLKTHRGEESDITAVVSRFILGNNDIAFKYIADGKTVYQSFGDGMESAMVSVYGAGILENCYLVNSEKNGITVTGYIGKPFYTKSNKTYQTFFLNGRYIVNQTISAAIGNAYSSYLMKRQYPFYVLSVTVPPQTVDVNVHPNKTDVRFSNNQIIYGALYSVVSKVLDGVSEALNIIVETKPTSDEDKPNNYKTNTDLDTVYVTHKVLKSVPDKYSFGKISFRDSGAKSLSESYKTEIIQEKNDKENKDTKDVADIFAENKAYLERLEKIKAEKNISGTEQTKITLKRELRYVGQVLNTYLILDDGADVYFADQHAAHERILYDKFNLQIETGEIPTQSLLFPFIIDVNSVEREFLSEQTETLNNMGIDISEFGENAFKISSLPVLVAEMNIANFFKEILSDLSGLRGISVKNVLQEKIAQKACKAAIKSGDVLREQEIEVLIAALNENIGLKCPHGRPVAVKITRTEIDKWFKRII